MQRVTILGFDDSMATTLFGPMDIFNQAGRLWNRIHQTPQAPLFDVTIASPDGMPIRTANNVAVQPHCGIAAIRRTDLVLIASATSIERIVDAHPGLVPWIRRQYDSGAHVASVCTGAFLLAETGLLDGKTATLHWGFIRAFRERYPRVDLEPERMIIDHGRLYCAAGVNAGMDLALYLVEKFCGAEKALESARTMILELGRTTQAPYGCFHAAAAVAHEDPVVADLQRWIDTHYTQPVDYDRLAGEYRMSRRSLERRFKAATGLTPLGYLQRLRVESAKRMLAAGRCTVGEIADRVGYEDLSFFRKLFVRLTGLSPSAYQRRFAGYGARRIEGGGPWSIMPDDDGGGFRAG